MSYEFQPDDIQILRLLQQDARLTTKEIADKLGKSVTPVYERIKRLEREEVISKYVAILNKTKIDRSLIGFMQVHLKEHSRGMLIAFKEQACKFREVMECYHMSGAADYLLKIAMRDMNEYNIFLLNKLSTLPNIQTVQTFFVISEGKVETAYPLSLAAVENKGRQKGENRQQDFDRSGI